MRAIRLVLLGSAIITAALLAGCDDGQATAGDSATPGKGGAVTATSQAAGMDAETKAACTALGKDIDTALAEIAKAEKIGPPAGHSAVSAQYSAGAAALYADMITAGDEVNAAAKRVATEMSDLADAYATAPKQAPDKAALNTSVKELKAACAAG
jgi:hypothetical protein